MHCDAIRELLIETKILLWNQDKGAGWILLNPDDEKEKMTGILASIRFTCDPNAKTVGPGNTKTEILLLDKPFYVDLNPSETRLIAQSASA